MGESMLAPAEKAVIEEIEEPAPPRPGTVTEAQELLAALQKRLSPFGRVPLSWCPLAALLLELPPDAAPLRGKPSHTWRLELLVAPILSEFPKRLPWKKTMRRHFPARQLRPALVFERTGVIIPPTFDGWWWHAGAFTAAELGGELTLSRFSRNVARAGRDREFRISPAQTSRWSVWLDAKTEGNTVIGGTPP